MFKRSGSVVMIGVVLATVAVVLALGSSGNSTSPNDHNINSNVTSGNVSSAVPPEVIKQLIYKDSTEEGDGKLLPQVLEREAQKDYDDIKGKILGWSQKHFWVIILIAIIVVLCIGALCLCLLCKK